MTLDKWQLIFSNRILTRLKELNMTQAKLAELTGVHVASISNYVCGKRIPKADVLINLAKALRCSVSDLIEVGEMIDLEGEK